MEQAAPPQNPHHNPQECNAMSAQSFETHDDGEARTSRAGRSRVAAGGHGKYQLDVTALDVGDVVRSAGGWLFDRAMAGWDVNVVLAGAGDVRPLEILGLSTYRHEPDDESSAPPRALALAVSSGMVTTDPRLCGDVLRALKRGLTEVTLWGDAWQAGLDSGAKPVEHILSGAARAFKAQALAALGATDPVGPIETFRNRTTALHGGYSDLMPSAASSLAQR
jgi:hypothetical protein